MARVLIVENSNFQAARLRSLLEDCGHEVIGHERDAASGVRAYRECLVTMDLVMPSADGLQGIDAIGRICSIDPKARILVSTGMVQGSVVYEGLAAGASGYVLKPIDAERMREAVTECLETDPTGPGQSSERDILDPDLLDKLMEAVSVGAGHAASTLGRALERRIDLASPEASLLPRGPDGWIEGIGEPDFETVGTAHTVQVGDTAGTLGFLLSFADAQAGWALLTGAGSGIPNEQTRSSVVFLLGQTLSESFVPALAAELEVPVTLGEARLLAGPLRQVMRDQLAFPDRRDPVLVVSLGVNVRDTDLSGRMLVLWDDLDAISGLAPGRNGR